MKIKKKKNKSTESITRFMKRRGKETGKITIPQTKPTPPMAGGSHTLMAAQREIGVVKPKMRKMLSKAMHKKKKRQLMGEAN